VLQYAWYASQTGRCYYNDVQFGRARLLYINGPLLLSLALALGRARQVMFYNVKAKDAVRELQNYFGVLQYSIVQEEYSGNACTWDV